MSGRQNANDKTGHLRGARSVSGPETFHDGTRADKPPVNNKSRAVTDTLTRRFTSKNDKPTSGKTVRSDIENARTVGQAVSKDKSSDPYSEDWTKS